MEELFISGYIRTTVQLTVPFDIRHMISQYSQGKDGTLMVTQNETKVLRSDYQYEFTNVIIESGGTLTVDEWDPIDRHGGTLLMTVLRYCIIKHDGEIQLDAKGYNGGASCWSGESYKHKSLRDGKRNLGGGGGGGWSSYSGGGGYGTAGETNSYSSRDYDNGGQIYGDRLLSTLHLGSGGGGLDVRGGHGGGALRIECVKFENYGTISVNGENSKSTHDGAGSGGSVFIICQQFQMNTSTEIGFIYACGGKHPGKSSSTWKDRGGEGGDGRIRIKTKLSLVKDCVTVGQIKPSPYIG